MSPIFSIERKDARVLTASLVLLWAIAVYREYY